MGSKFTKRCELVALLAYDYEAGHYYRAASCIDNDYSHAGGWL